jgi:hypothetical protein
LKPRAFTIRYTGIRNVLSTNIGVSLPSEDPQEIKNFIIGNYQAIWDTGATNSVITTDVVRQLNLKPTGITEVLTAGGVSQQNVYLINLYLPNRFAVPFIRVTECPMLTGNFNILIGMDIISLGDFIVNNFQNHTQFSFRMPSLHEIDYEEMLKTNDENLSRQQKRKIKREYDKKLKNKKKRK